MGVIWAPMNQAFGEKFDRIQIFHNGELKVDGEAKTHCRNQCALS